MKKQSGFTLIEMVVVIVIVGILSATAAPKFLNLQSDARVSTLKGAEGAIRAADNIVFGKAAIKGIDRELDGIVKVGDTKIKTKYGHIVTNKKNITKGVELSGYSVLDIKDNQSHQYTVVTLDSIKWDADNTECHVEIRQDSDTGKLECKQVTNGC
ncbi:type II secretion system protein [Vibrio sp. HN007]|uniref:type II secretion system protein n=1 Tax=Vibrio iocasae TaxID=3098914 RepID=UPI0035D4BC4E